MNKDSLKNDFFATVQFAQRNILLFFRDKATVFFSLLSPLIVLMLYVFFLGDLQVLTVKSYFPEGVQVDEKLISAFVDSWLIAGIMCVSSLTVALNSMLVMVSDKEKNLFKDFTSTPVKPSVLTLGYFLSFYFITLLICLAVFAVGLIYLAASGSFYMTASDVFVNIGVLLLSVTNSVLLMMFVMSFINTSSASGAFSGIFSAVIGFLVGAYMPISAFPEGIRYFTTIIPGSSTGGLFRNYFMDGALQELSKNMPPAFTDGLKQAFSFELEFFSYTPGTDFMWIYLADTALLFLLCNIVAGIIRKRKGVKIHPTKKIEKNN